MKQIERLDALTSLRFFAAAALVVHHTTWYFGYGTHLASILPLDLGVSFFFVLSGFILTHVHPEVPTPRAAADFVIARIAKIWPSHIAMLIAVLALLPYPWNAGPIDPGMRPPLLENVLLLQSWFPLPSSFFSFNGVSWSISTELFFYAMFPLLIWGWEKTKWTKLAAAFMLAVLCIIYTVRAGLPLLTDKNVRSMDSYVYVFPPARLFEFVLGMVTASLWKRHREALDTVRTATVLQIVALLVTVVGMPMALHYAPHLSIERETPYAVLKWVTACGMGPVFAFAIIAMSLRSGMIARALSGKVLVFLGEISFAVYMTHQVVIRFFDAHPAVFGAIAMPVRYGLYWAIVIALSWLLWACVEKPCRHIIIRRIRFSSARSPHPTTANETVCR